MQFAVRRANGDLLSNLEYANIREYADLLVRNLLDKYDPRPAGAKSMPKREFKTKFNDQYREAILELEAKEPILRLCAAHWKAEVMISQSFLRRSQETSKAARGRSVVPSEVNSSQLPEPLPAVPIPMVWDSAPTNTSKRALEMSPGPKSPSSSHTQKRTKDNITQKVSSSLVPPGEYYSIQFKLLNC